MLNLQFDPTSDLRFAHERACRSPHAELQLIISAAARQSTNHELDVTVCSTRYCHMSGPMFRKQAMRPDSPQPAIDVVTVGTVQTAQNI